MVNVSALLFVKGALSTGGEAPGYALTSSKYTLQKRGCMFRLLLEKYFTVQNTMKGLLHEVLSKDLNVLN